MNIYQKINEVRKAVPYIKKDKTVQGYKAVSHDAVTAQLHDACVEHGIVIIPSEGKHKIMEIGKTTSGAVRIRYEAKYTISFVNTEEPSDKIEMKIRAHADDHGDKAPGKCLSYAVKSAMLKVFMLETGEDDESRVEPERLRKEKITDAQVEWINEIIKNKGVEKDKFEAWLKKNRINSIEEINQSFFKDVQLMLKNYKKPEVKKDAK